MNRFAALWPAFVAAGCGAATPPPSGPAKITWTEYQAMDAEQKTDPYVVDNLDDDARQKRARQGRRTK